MRTSPRTEDIASIVRILNDPKVHKNLASPPVPYSETDASGFLSKLKPPSDAILKELEEASQEEPAGLKIVGGCPVRILREVQEDGSDIFLGDIGTRRCPFPGVLDSEEQLCLANANADLPVGDEGIVWCIACEYRTLSHGCFAQRLHIISLGFLASSHYGRGIMPLALQTLIDKWMVPRMNAQAIRAEVFKGNRASARIFEKCGFVQT